MNIVIINTLYFPYSIGGAEKSVKSLAENFTVMGNNVAVITLAEEQSIATFNDVTIHRLRMENTYFPFNGAVKTQKEKLIWHLKDVKNTKYNSYIKNFLISFKTDILFTNNISGFSVNVWQIAKILNIKIVHTLRDYYLQCSKTTKFKNDKNCEKICLDCKILSYYKKKCTVKIDYVIGTSNYILKDHLKNGFFNGVSNKVIYNGFDILPQKKTAKQEAIKIVNFGFIGQINKSKGIELLLKCFINLKSDDCKLLIAGKISPGYLRYLQNEYKSKNITFLGYMESTFFFRKIDVLIVPSLWNEPFGRVVLESLINEKPVLGSARGGIKELLKNNTPFVFEPAQKNLTELLEKIILEPNFLKEFIFDRKFIEDFKITQTAGQYITIFNKLLNG
ncbi:glycosyltransferase family 4 protein [Polaribacter sp. IC063]|uniref:glycosyltransferase family 4 protein n=1 Tax=Polaribacter sp. IC063 TaxID=57031 RepID=UPI0011BD5C3B|nr:glycosyltransferase family 4 protein [Polaribacter sp. IC063]TXD54235.1 glycosyltransferase [Polaribacter sp. IC063]